MKLKKDSATYYLLTTLVPYTKANIAYNFAPSQYAKELAARYKLSERNVKTAYTRAVKSGLVELNTVGIPCLTPAGERSLAPFQAKQLKDSELMVVFDIPETLSTKRRQLRALLIEFQFRQIQRSVWVTSVDAQKYIQQGLEELGIRSYVQLYESRQIDT